MSRGSASATRCSARPSPAPPRNIRSLTKWAAKPTAMRWTEAAAPPMAVETAARALDLSGELAGRRTRLAG
jgi:hypothetical protein